MTNDTVAQICSPALVYLCFSLIQIIIDVYKRQFNTAFFKFWVMLIVTALLNILCDRGLSVVSWLIVFIPLILMSIILVVLIFFLGFRPGQVNKIFNVKNQPNTDKLRLQMMLNQQKIQSQTKKSELLDNVDPYTLETSSAKNNGNNAEASTDNNNDLEPANKEGYANNILQSGSLSPENFLM
jgi:hypothetical protein